jgi:ABC-type multidrug transport system fused ATPase/permease subunit
MSQAEGTLNLVLWVAVGQLILSIAAIVFAAYVAYCYGMTSFIREWERKERELEKSFRHNAQQTVLRDLFDALRSLLGLHAALRRVTEPSGDGRIKLLQRADSDSLLTGYLPANDLVTEIIQSLVMIREYTDLRIKNPELDARVAKVMSGLDSLLGGGEAELNLPDELYELTSELIVFLGVPAIVPFDKLPAEE